jgi:hypothetical protein
MYQFDEISRRINPCDHRWLRPPEFKVVLLGKKAQRVAFLSRRIMLLLHTEPLVASKSLV